MPPDQVARPASTTFCVSVSSSALAATSSRCDGMITKYTFHAIIVPIMAPTCR